MNVSEESTRFTPRMAAADRKRQIVEVALDLIAKHGLQGVTMSRIAAGAGIRQASLYSHFQSRHEILLAALDVIYERIYASRMTRSNENTLARLREICDHHIELWVGQGERHHAQLLLEFVAGAPGEGLRETLASKHLETLKEFVQIVERGKAEGKDPFRMWTPSRLPGSSPASRLQATSRRPWASSISWTRRSRAAGWTSCSPALWPCPATSLPGVAATPAVTAQKAV